MKLSAKILNRRALLFGLLSVLTVIGVFWMNRASSRAPTYTGIIERRDYQLLVLPLDGTSLNARVDRIKHRFVKPGQAKLFERFTSSSPPVDLQSALIEFGYKFPVGTKAVSLNSTIPTFYIQHYPDVLDSLEEEFQLEHR